MTDTEFEAIKARHEHCNFTVTKTEWNEREAFNAHTDRATLIAIVESERARADKAKTELDAEQIAGLKTRAELTEARRELAALREAARPILKLWQDIQFANPYAQIDQMVWRRGEADDGPYELTCGHLRALARAVGEEG